MFSMNSAILTHLQYVSRFLGDVFMMFGRCLGDVLGDVFMIFGRCWGDVSAVFENLTRINILLSNNMQYLYF